MEVKGSAIIVLPKFIKSNFGTKNLNIWLDSLSEEAKKVYKSKILISSWFPLKTVFVEPTRKMCDMFYRKNLKGAWEVGRFSAEYSLKEFYKAYVRVATPQSLTKRASQIFGAYYKPSSMRVIEISEKKILLKITEFPEMDEIVENRILGWVEKALEICDCKNIKLEVVKSLIRGDPASEIDITWD
ncbi:hypothetical protein JW879_00355 [candidate division WOR-3 bacterium]|nr:hypothetical protein [candidate division WOR-3 bacterium]